MRKRTYCKIPFPLLKVCPGTCVWSKREKKRQGDIYLQNLRDLEKYGNFWSAWNVWTWYGSWSRAVCTTRIQMIRRIWWGWWVFELKWEALSLGFFFLAVYFFSFFFIWLYYGQKLYSVWLYWLLRAVVWIVIISFSHY